MPGASVISETWLWAGWAAAAAPFAAFVLILFLLRRRPGAAAAVSLAAVATSMVFALCLLVCCVDMETPLRSVVTWMISGDTVISAGVHLDGLSLLMLAVVCGICLLVQVYSLGYMAGDPGFARYYAFMSLFAGAMIFLVLAPGLVQLYIFWELVGLSSYLLIGFWFEKFSASRAGKKAFVMTRLGDVAFLAGLLLLLVRGGVMDIAALSNGAAGLSSGMITVSAVLIFGGVIGKSAQFPLMTWLPDAMEGPTPVSALLHSATMVAAGVFLIARMFPFFSQSDAAMTFLLAVGTVSMLMSATMAMVSRDIKQVWAYSTISQLGFMLMALAAGGYFAGVFHLFTHAGFKALLFLCAGMLIHAFHSNDMFVIGQGGARGLKIPMLCMAVGAAALSGIWPFSGFASKEAVLATLVSLENPAWLIAGLAGVFLTAYYTFRLVFIIVFPAGRGQTRAEDPARGVAYAYGAMAWPVILLAFATLVLGFLAAPIRHWLAAGAGAHEAVHGPAWLAPLSLGLVFAAIAVAWVEFGRKNASQTGFVERVRVVAELFARRWYLDDIWGWAVSRLLDRGAAEACRQADNRVIDGFVHSLAGAAVVSGRVLARGHRVMIQARLMIMFAVVFGLTCIMLIWG
ncbi:MAG: NADH-quinone oxidoreductase subunit L [Desulfobacterales bacterium]|nr:NADH-quinone oxidoreductase subunit L [Desulfobacterales bacterium]